jgi:UDP-N-acetylglucosamine:LPS N-acetylglucosamine transferase
VLNLLHSPDLLQQMAQKAGKLGFPDSAERLADLVRQTL